MTTTKAAIDVHVGDVLTPGVTVIAVDTLPGDNGTTVIVVHLDNGETVGFEHTATVHLA
jgi:hypothetical protein